jgi:hypothetical protein
MYADRNPNLRLGVEDYSQPDLEAYANRETVDENTWKKEYSLSNVPPDKWKFEPGHTKDFWELNKELKQEEIKRQIDIKQADIGWAQEFALGILPNLLDPINLISSVVPIAKAAPIAGYIGRAASTPLRKAALAGAIEGGVSNLPVEALVYTTLAGERQYDYGMADALANVLMAPVVGAAFHSVFGRGEYKSKVADALDNGKSPSDIIDDKTIKKAIDDFKNDTEVKDALAKLPEEERVVIDRQLEAEKNTDDLVGRLQDEEEATRIYEARQEEADRLAAEKIADEGSAGPDDTPYVAEDGTSFRTPEEVIAHETDLDKAPSPEQIVQGPPEGIKSPTEYQPGDITKAANATKEAQKDINKNLMRDVGTPRDVARSKDIFGFGKIEPRLVDLVKAFETITTEVLERMKALEFKKDVNGERLVSNDQWKWLVKKTIGVRDKIGLYQQNIEDFYKIGKEFLQKNPTGKWMDVADRWGGNEKDFMKYLAKRFDGAQKAGIDIDTLPKAIITEMIDNAKKQHTASVLSLVRYVENLDRITRVAKANGISEANVLLADMIGHTSLGWLGDTKHFAGLRNSVDGNAKSIERGVLGELRARLEAIPGLWKMVDKTRTTVPFDWMGKIPGSYFNVGDKQFQLQIRQALWSIDLETGKAKLRTSEPAAQAAEIIHSITKDLVDRQNAVGANIDLRNEYGAKQRHVREKLLYSEDTKEKSKATWKEYIKGQLDLVKSFGAKTDKEIDRILDDVYSHITTGAEKKRGYDTNFDDAYDFHFGVDERAPTKLSEKISKERQLIFRDADAQHAYDMKYGSGDLMDNIFYGITKASGNIALMSKFGPDPDGVFGALYNRIITLSKADSDAGRQLADDITGKRGAWLQRAYDEVSGVAGRPQDVSLARVGRGIRAWQVITKLSTAAISSIGDIATSAEALRFQGMSGYKAWTSAIGQVTDLFHKDADKKEVARLIGIGLDGMVSDVMSRYSRPEDMAGKMSKAMGLMFKLNGLEHWTDSHKFAAGLMLSSHIAEHTNLDFDGLAKANKKLFSQMTQYGIDATDWELIRKYGVSTVKDTKYITSDAMKNIPDQEIKDIAGTKLTGTLGLEVEQKLGKDVGNISDAMINNYRRELGDKLRNYLVDFTDHAIPTPGARQRIYMSGSSQAGSVLGEAARFFWQFKSFPLTVFQQSMERAAEEGGSVKTLNGLKSGAGSLIPLTIGLTAAGYASMAVKDALNGKTPRDIFDFETEKGGIPVVNSKGFRVVIDALAQGGILGIYGDVLLSEARRYGQNPLTRFAGPTAGTLMDAVGIVQDLKMMAAPGKERHPENKFYADTFNFTKRHILPYQLPVVKQVLDYMVLNSIQEGINPGYLRRVEQDIQKNREQTYFDFMKPSENRVRVAEELIQGLK